MADKKYGSAHDRVRQFTDSLGIRLPILLAPMAGVPSPSLSIAVGHVGGLGACGALMMQPAEITGWSEEVRKGTAGGFQINLWIPEAAPLRDPEVERRQRHFLSNWGPAVAQEA